MPLQSLVYGIRMILTAENCNLIIFLKSFPFLVVILFLFFASVKCFAVNKVFQLELYEFLYANVLEFLI